MTNKPTLNDAWHIVCSILAKHGDAPDPTTPGPDRDLIDLARVVVACVVSIDGDHKPPFASDQIDVSTDQGVWRCMIARGIERDALALECVNHQANRATDRETMSRIQDRHSAFVSRLAKCLSFGGQKCGDDEREVEHYVRHSDHTYTALVEKLAERDATIVELRRSVDAILLILQNTKKPVKP